MVAVRGNRSEAHPVFSRRSDAGKGRLFWIQGGMNRLGFLPPQIKCIFKKHPIILDDQAHRFIAAAGDDQAVPAGQSKI